MRPDAEGLYIPNGIWVEWYESRELKRFVDYVKGEPHGVELTWSPDGQVVSRVEYQHEERIKVRGESCSRKRVRTDQRESIFA